MAGLRLGSSSTNSGDLDDNPGFEVPDAGQCFRLPRIAKDQSGYPKNKLMDATILLRCCAPRHDASGDYRRHDAFSSGRLRLVVRRPDFCRAASNTAGRSTFGNSSPRLGTMHATERAKYS